MDKIISNRLKDGFNRIVEYFNWQFLLILCSFAWGIHTFFLNSALLESFSEVWIKFYFDLSRTIFLPQTEFYGESVLLPLLSLALGGTKHWLFYKIFCSFCALLILPTTAYFSIRYFKNGLCAWIFTVLFAFTFRYFWDIYYLGFPDPLTIICLAAVALQPYASVGFIFAFLSSTSHFSISLLGLGALSLLIITAPTLSKQVRTKAVFYTILGLVTGRLFLQIWFYLFDYRIQNRFDWAMNFGISNFISRYQENVVGFWMTPQLPFLVLFAVICFWFLRQKKIIFVFLSVLSLLVAYGALFLTVDGLRVFSTVITAPYIFMIRTFVEDIYSKY